MASIIAKLAITSNTPGLPFESALSIHTPQYIAANNISIVSTNAKIGIQIFSP